VATPPADLGGRIRTAVAHERREEHRRGRGRQLLAAAAAVVALLVVGGVGVAVGERRDDGPAVPLEAVSVRTDVPGLSADAGVVPHTWGVEISWRRPVRGRRVLPGDRADRGRAGPSGGAFVGTGERVMSCNLNSDVLRADAAGFTVVDARGATVLTAELPDA
jgi:hypothetical protein